MGTTGNNNFTLENLVPLPIVRKIIRFLSELTKHIILAILNEGISSSNRKQATLLLLYLNFIIFLLHMTIKLFRITSTASTQALIIDILYL